MTGEREGQWERGRNKGREEGTKGERKEQRERGRNKGREEGTKGERKEQRERERVCLNMGTCSMLLQRCDT